MSAVAHGERSGESPVGRTPPPRPSSGPESLMLAVAVLLIVLAAVVAVRVVADADPGWPLAVVLCVAIVAAHLVGQARRRRHRRAALWWFALTVALWVGLVGLNASGVFVGFALFFVAADLFRGRLAVAVVAGMLAVIILGEIAHTHELNAAGVVGPIIGGGVALAMSFGYRSLERENEARRRLIEELEAAHAELAVSERRRGVAQERERLAREIHDTLAQGLSSIIFLLRAGEAELDTDAAAARAHIAQARDAAQQNLEEARRFVRALSPPDLVQAPLAEALQRLCATISARSGVDIRFVAAGDPVELPAPIEVVLLRVAQGALANVVGHARAHRARVTLSAMPDQVSLDVADDGRGFDPAARGSGFGLTSMARRVADAGGTFSIESAPGDGTVVTASLPHRALTSVVDGVPMSTTGPGSA